MATNTPNYNLIKPDGNDPVNIGDINGNSDIIDTTLKNLNDRILPLATQSQAQDGLLNTVIMTPATTTLNHVRKRLTRTNNLDLNTFVQDGEYALGTGTNTGGTAISFANFGILKTITSGDVIHQTIYQFQGDVYERIFTTNDNVRPAFRMITSRDFTGVYANQAQAQAGTDNATLMTPLRTLQSISSNSLAKNIRIPSSTDINTILEPGMYDVSQSSNTSPNLPPNAYTYGNLLVFTSSFGGSKATTQIYASHGTNTKAIYFRVYYTSGTWTDWVRLDNVIPSKQQAINGTDNTMTMTPQRTKDVIDNSPITRYGTCTGTNALTITANPLFDNLYAGLTIKFKNTTTNTGNVTANVNTKGVKSVLNNDGTQIQPGKMKENSMYEITYDGTNFYLTKGGGDSSPIKRVQRGNLNMSGSSLTIDSTVLDFNVNKSVVVISVSTITSSITGTSTANNILAEIVDNTTLRFSRNATSINNLLLEWQLIEFEDYVNVQTGTIDLTDASLNVSISNVDINKSILYFSFNSSSIGEYAQSTGGRINNSTTLSFRRGSDEGINKIRWFVVEIK